MYNNYIFLDVLFCSIAEFLQTTSKNFHRYYTTKRLIRDLLSNTPNSYVLAGVFHGYLFSGKRGTELAREIQLTDWVTAAEQGKPV